MATREPSGLKEKSLASPPDQRVSGGSMMRVLSVEMRHGYPAKPDGEETTRRSSLGWKAREETGPEGMEAMRRRPSADHHSMEGPLMVASQRLERSKAKDWRVASTARARDLRPRVERPVPGRAVH